MPVPHDRETPGLHGPDKRHDSPVSGFAASALGFVGAAVGLVLAFMFSLVLAAVLLTAGVAFGGWFWWKTRTLRQQLREQPLQAGRPGEREVEGVVVEFVSVDRGERR